MRCVFRGVLYALFATALMPSLLVDAQQTPDTFRWIDFHSAKDQDVVIWVTRSLAVEPWTAIREIGVEYDAALVVTANRATPQSNPKDDTFGVWSVSLTNHSVTPLLKGVNLRLLDWMLFAAGRPRELGVLYDNCRECNASTFFTAFYYDQRLHAWSARWMRGEQAIPLTSASSPDGVTVTQVYAGLADPNGHEVIATWSHFDYGKQKPPEDYIYEYDVDPFTGLDRTQVVSGKAMPAVEKQLCQATGDISGIAHGQDSVLCQETLEHPTERRVRRR